MSAHRMNSGMPINGTNNNYRRPINFNRAPAIPFERPVLSQHDDLIKFIHESWNKVSQEVNRNTVTYFQEQEPDILKHFEPFNLEAYCGRRAPERAPPNVQYMQRGHHS